ncbi:MAG: permease [Spirochaetales bacterium]|nr:permease [Spirochaetales bacterium]
MKKIKERKTVDYIFSALVMVSFFMLFLFIDDILGALTPFTFINAFIVTFVSIILEALPFLLVGCIVSAILEVYISDSAIARFIPQNKFIGVIVTSLLGLLFPVCECATVPIVRRLRKKGVPLYIAITFMVAVPIINPTVILSTSYAFWDRPLIIFLRVACGFIGAITIGLLISFLESKKIVKNVMLHENKKAGLINAQTHEHEEGKGKKNILNRLPGLFHHAGLDFYETGRYFILGAFLASLLHYIIPKDILLSLGQNKFISLIIMGIFAFALSVCSEADAFIARKFVSQFTSGSLVVFLILGPMIDIKNTLMLASAFKARFIIILGIIIFIVCVVLGSIINFTPMGDMV